MNGKVGAKRLMRVRAAVAGFVGAHDAVWQLFLVGRQSVTCTQPFSSAFVQCAHAYLECREPEHREPIPLCCSHQLRVKNSLIAAVELSTCGCCQDLCTSRSLGRFAGRQVSRRAGMWAGTNISEQVCVHTLVYVSTEPQHEAAGVG